MPLRPSPPPSIALLLALVALAGCASIVRAQQVTDSTFQAAVAHPTFKDDKRPIVFFDEGHRNAHTLDGRFKPFGKLLEADGYRVLPSRQRFSEPLLRNCEVMVLVDATSTVPAISVDPAGPAFSDIEVKAMRNWLEAGGSLLFVAEHHPFGAAVALLARDLRVDMSNRYTVDGEHEDPTIANAGCILYTQENKLLGDHPILRGVRRVTAYTGQSLKGPNGSVALLKLADSAQDVSASDSVSAAGRAQGIAFEVGKGRVVVLADAAMLTAQFSLTPNPRLPLGKPVAMGLNRPDLDNRQFALNVMHWLSRELK